MPFSPSSKQHLAKEPASELADAKLFDLFISFSTRDRRQPWFSGSVDVVSEIKTALERYRHPDTNQRLRVCTYEEDFELRADVREAIARNIDQSAAFLFLSTKNAAGSDYVQFEISHAAETHARGRLLVAIVDQEPDDAFPLVFPSGIHAADLSTMDCTNLKSWRRRVELETAKIAARVWDVPLQRIRDRFVIERRQQRVIRYGGLAIALIVISIAVVAGVSQYNKRETGRKLAVHQQYAADMATVQRDWDDGHVDKARVTLERYRSGNMDPDPRSFEWYTFWRVVTAERLATGEFGNIVSGLAVSPSASIFAFSAENQPVKIVNIEDGQIIATLSNVSVAAHSLTFTADGSKLVGVVPNGILFWDVRQNTESVVKGLGQVNLKSLVCHPTKVECAAVDEVGMLYKIVEEQATSFKSNLFKSVKNLRLAFSSDGRWLAALGEDGKFLVADTSDYSRRIVKMLPEVPSNQNFVLSDSKAFVITGDHITTIDLQTGKTDTSRRLVNGTNISGIAIDNSRKLLAVGDPSDQSVVIREIESWRELGSVKGYRGWLDKVYFVQNSSYLVASSLGGDVKVWDVARIGSRVVREQPGTIQSIVFLPKTQDVVTHDSEGWIRCWNTATLKEHWKRRIGEGTSWDNISLRAQHIAVSDDSMIRLLDPENGNEVVSFPGYYPLASSADNTVFAYVHAEDDAVVIEDVATGAKTSLPIRKPEPEDLDISAMALTSNGLLLLVATADGRVMLFDLKTKELKFEFQGHKGVIYAISISPDERFFATASSDQTTGLWEIMTGLAVAKLEGHTASVQAVAFSPDGKTLVSGNQKGIIKFWNVQSLLPTITFYSHQIDLHPGVKTLTFGEAGNLLVSGGSLGTVILWEADAQN